MNNSTLIILITIAIVAMIDYIPRVVLLFKKTNVVKPGYGKVPKYLIMPTVYGDISYLQNISFLKKYSSKVVICTSKYETDEFYKALRKVCKRYGFRYIKAELPNVKGVPTKNAYTIYKGAISNLKNLHISKNTPCLLIDAGTYSLDNVNNLVRTFNELGCEIASLRCEVAKPKTAIQRLQAYEYSIAMDNRRMDPWLTSGACNIARATTLQKVLSLHSNFFVGGDIEIGKIAQVMGYKIKHIAFTFYTYAPSTVKSWFKQRTNWLAGGFRHHITNIGSFGWHHFFLLFYNSLLVYMLFPLRWVELLNFPITMVALIVLSWIYTAILYYDKGWSWVYLFLPLYSFVQSMIILPLAVIKYFKLTLQHRSLGILKYDLSSVNISTRVLYSTLNVTSALLVMYVGIYFTSVRINYWEHHSFILQLFR